jgi:hypothetical protein
MDTDDVKSEVSIDSLDKTSSFNINKHGIILLLLCTDNNNYLNNNQCTSLHACIMHSHNSIYCIICLQNTLLKSLNSQSHS